MLRLPKKVVKQLVAKQNAKLFNVAVILAVDWMFFCLFVFCHTLVMVAVNKKFIKLVRDTSIFCIDGGFLREVKCVRNEDEPVATKGKLVFIPLVHRPWGR